MRGFARGSAKPPPVLGRKLRGWQSIFALVLVSCRAGDVGVIRLADLAAGDRGEAPVATIANQMRYVLATPVGALLYPSDDSPPSIAVAADGTVALELVCPEALAGADVVLTVNLARGVWQERARCPVDVAKKLPFRIARLTPGDEVRPFVLVKGVPVRATKTRRLRLRRGAVLRVALGIVDPTESPVRFRIVARSRRSRPVAVLDRTLDPAHRPGDRGWVDVEVPVEGRDDVRLAFRASTAGPSAWPVMPVWGDPTITGAGPRARRPNVILISLDTLRADRLGCYGAARATSPALDRLAAGGAVFETAITAAPWTLPSHLTMLSGVYPCAHGLVTRAIVRRPTPGLRSLARILRDAGYATVAFTEDGYLLPGVFQPGFGLFSYAVSGVDGVEQRVTEARDWLETHAGSPFFLFIHTYQVHWPYQSPPPHRGMFTDGKAPGTNELDDYDGALHYADTTLAGLFQAVDDLGIGKRTIVVVTSDHGEAFHEHGTTRHGNALFEELLRVPFIWHAPGLIAPGRRIADVVGLVDVVPTVLDLVGLPVPDLLQGRSLAPFLRREGSADATDPQRVLFSENASERDTLVARTTTWKAVFETAGTMRVHDLLYDPDERSPISGNLFAPAAVDARTAFLEECEHVRAGLAARAPATEPAPAPTDVPDAEQRQRLRALGYAD